MLQNGSLYNSNSCSELIVRCQSAIHQISVPASFRTNWKDALSAKPSHVNQLEKCCFRCSPIIKSKINHTVTSFYSTPTCTTFRFGRGREKVKWGAAAGPCTRAHWKVLWGYYRFDYWVPQGNWLKWGLTAMQGNKQLESSSLPAAILRPFHSQVPQLLWSVIKAQLMKSWWK